MKRTHCRVRRVGGAEWPSGSFGTELGDEWTVQRFDVDFDRSDE